MATDLMRAFRGYGQINQFWGRGWNKYHSIQTSYNRRFTDGLSFGVNWTLGLSNTTNAGARLQHGADGQLEYRADQEEADRILGRGQLQRHTIKGTFVWDLPDLERGTNTARQVLAAVANDWQLSGIYSGQSGDRYISWVRLSGRRRQREHHGVAQLRRTRGPQRGSRIGLCGQSVRAVQHRGGRRPAGGQRGARVGPELPDRLLRELHGIWPSRGTSGWAAAAWSSSASRCSTRSTRWSTRTGTRR